MLNFKNDYSEGACSEVLEALVKTNYEQTVGYGEDEYCEEARNLIKENINYSNADIYFLVGGTQANTTVISHSLKPYEAGIACKTGHISIHETGAIEATGHKIIEVDGIDGKLTPDLILNELRKHEDHHMVKPKMVYISNTTEIGTVYTKSELESISKVCKNIPLSENLLKSTVLKPAVRGVTAVKREARIRLSIGIPRNSTKK